jgi:hypothetical protein
MQHFRRLAATIVVGSLAGMGFGAVMWAPALAQALPPLSDAAIDPVASSTTQRGVPAEATAENAVIARTRAIASAQRIAYERMATELGLPRGLSDSQIDSMVSSIIVEEERSSRTGYSGRFTVNFNPNRLPGANRGMAGSAGGAAPPLRPGDAAAPPVMPRQAPAGFIQAEVRYGGLREWLEVRRRLASNPEIASVDVEAIAVDGARLRLGLRHDPQTAAQALSSSGLAMAPGLSPQPASSPAPGRLAPPVPWGAPAPATTVPSAPAEAGMGPWQLGLTGGL